VDARVRASVLGVAGVACSARPTPRDLVDALNGSSVVWREPGDSCARLLVIENSEVVLSGAVDANATPPIPPGHRRPATARRAAFTLASFDRLRVFTTELKRLIAAGAPVALRLGAGPPFDESRLASALWWV
jgi:DNA polymerase-3 subunit epsilon